MQPTLNKSVLLLTDGIYPFVTGGMQKHSYFLTKYLLQANYTVHLFHCVESDKAIPDEMEVKEYFSELNTNLQSTCLHFPSGIRFPGHYLSKSYKYSKQLYNLVSSKIDSYDFIYIQGFTGWYLLKKFKEKKIAQKTIINFHGLEMFQIQPDFKGKLQAILLRHFVRKNINRSPYVHSLGGKLTEIIKEKLKVDESKILSVPIGIETNWLTNQQFNKTESKINIGFIGRNERRKGFPELMDAIKSLSKTNFHFHIIGPFEKSESTLITFYGLIKNENEIKEILDKCQVLICPSYSEGMPTVILEAMSRGCAIAATDVGAVSEQVDHLNGWIFKPANSQELKKCLETILASSKEEINFKRKASIEKINKSFLWPTLIPKLFNQ